MAQILQIDRSDGSLDPEALIILGAVYDLAIADLCGVSEDTRSAIAGRIIAAGMDGQRDVKMLYAFAMGQVAGGKVAA
jgi:hypothetical protein